MDEPIELPVNYKGEEMYVHANVIAYGYSYKLSVDMNGTEVWFERDEQQQYRAILAHPETSKQADPEMIRAVLETLESL